MPRRYRYTLGECARKCLKYRAFSHLSSKEVLRAAKTWGEREHRPYLWSKEITSYGRPSIIRYDLGSFAECLLAEMGVVCMLCRSIHKSSYFDIARQMFCDGSTAYRYCRFFGSFESTPELGTPLPPVCAECAPVLGGAIHKMAEREYRKNGCTPLDEEMAEIVCLGALNLIVNKLTTTKGEVKCD